MKESVAIAKEADAMFLPAKSDKSIHRIQHEPERQLGSLRGVIDSIRHDGGTPSVDSIATELSSMHTAERGSVLLALQRTHGNLYVQWVVAGIQAKLKIGQPGDEYELKADRVADAVMRMSEPQVQRQAEEVEEERKKEEEQIQRQPERLIQRVVEGDITHMCITEDWGRNLNDDELEEQTNIVWNQLMTLEPTTPEHDAARQNLRILEAEAARRLGPLTTGVIFFYQVFCWFHSQARHLRDIFCDSILSDYDFPRKCLPLSVVC